MEDGVLISSGRICVPAKAMLFGEYGVLRGEPAVAATLPAFPFEVQCEAVQLSGTDGEPAVLVESAWFPTGELKVGRDRIAFGTRQPHAGLSRDEGFFLGIVWPFAPLWERLPGLQIRVRVVRSFAPDLGFGSSSALVAAIHLFLNEIREQHGETGGLAVRWGRIRTSLDILQGGGSGYDVAVQSAAAAAGAVRPALWAYQWAGGDAVPRWDTLVAPRGSLGLLLKSGQYGDTAEAVRRHARDGRSAEFGMAHGALARRFLSGNGYRGEGNIAGHHEGEAVFPGNEGDFSRDLAALMGESRCIARAQGILPPRGEGSALGQLATLLEDAGLPFKTMGAGFGDCLWVGCPRDRLTAAGLRHPVSREPLESLVVYEFPRFLDTGCAGSEGFQNGVRVRE